MLNPVWESNGYSTDAESVWFCGPTVHPALLEQRTWGADEAITFDVQVVRVGREMRGASLSW